ncbi:MAG: hypothetical protein QOH96_356 [Blastocatellia bacterium]|nr:hypothetical protein [Blastocatellia bacterium]
MKQLFYLACTAYQRQFSRPPQGPGFRPTEIPNNTEILPQVNSALLTAATKWNWLDSSNFMLQGAVLNPEKSIQLHKSGT